MVEVLSESAAENGSNWPVKIDQMKWTCGQCVSKVIFINYNSERRGTVLIVTLSFVTSGQEL